MADIIIRQIEEGMTGRQVADLLYSNFLALVGAIGSGGGGDIPTADIEKGVTAYGWGDHSKAGYLKGITAGMVTGALGYTPADEAAWTKANIKATLGIADWALAASKPTYTTKEVAEDGNLYFTDARAVAALAGVTDALAGDIGANATAIGVLQGYFTNGVAKSAAKLATSRKLWGQLFNGEADVTGALTGVTDITASGTLTIGKIKIGDGVIEWDAANGGFKVTGGLWATDYLSSKGVNTGASGGGGSSYQRLDTWDGYTTAKDGWVLSAKLGYGLKTTQDDILRQLADISGQGTNVTFTPSLTSGTQIGTLTIDGEPVKMYAPSIPTTDINKGVTAYGWGNHASAGYQPLITSTNKLAYSLISGVPTSLKNPNALTFGSKTYDGSAARTILASDLGALTAHQTIYALTIKNSAGTTQLTYTPNSAVGSLTLTKSMVGLSNVENTALSTWVGTNKITTLGTITTGVWNGTKIANGYLANSAITIVGTSVSLGGSITAATLQSNLGLGSFAYKSSLAFADLTNKPTTISGYGITDAITTANIGSQSVAIASDADMLDGKHLTDIINYIENPTTAIDLNSYTAKEGINVISYSNASSTNVANSPYSHATGVLSFGSRYTMQFATPYNSNKLVFRSYYNGWYDWREVAFTDSNVASATKLQTARTIWGQSFDGTGNISGALSGVSQIFFNSQNTHGIIRGNLYSSSLTEKDLVFNSPTVCFDGNLGIGTYNPQAKVDIEGVLFNRGSHYIYNSADRTDRLCLAWNSGTACVYSIKTDGSSYNSLRLGTTADGNRQLYYDNSTGNWGVGTSTPQYKLDVNGTLNASGEVTLGSTLRVASTISLTGTTAGTSTIAFGRVGTNYMTVPSGGSFTLGHGSSGAESMYQFTDGYLIAYMSATTLGNTSKRWATIYGVKGDFSGTLYATTGIWSDGYVSAKGQNTSSDMRLKRVLEEVTLSVDEIAAAPAVRFAWKGGAGVDVGTSAQYWEKVLPDVVKRDDAGWLTMQYGNAAMVAVIALARRVKELEEKLKIKS